MTATETFPQAGKTFTIEFENGLSVRNSYEESGEHVFVEFLSGEKEGLTMTVPFRWEALEGGSILVSWQESDKSTVVHCDDFDAGVCRAFYTTMDGDFFVMTGAIR